MTIKIHTATKDIKVPGTTWIQGLGHVYGKPAGEIRVGDTLIWNGGTTSTVVEIVQQTAATIVINEQYTDYQGRMQTYKRTLKKSRIVATPIADETDGQRG